MPAWLDREFGILYEKAIARGMVLLAVAIRDKPGGDPDEKKIDLKSPLSADGTAELFEMLAAGIREKIG